MNHRHKLRNKNKTPARTQIKKPSATTASHCQQQLQRQPWLDALRGMAVLAMIAYHFGFDLNFLGWLHQDLEHDLRWQIARWLILGSFLLSVGASHALAVAQHTPLRKQGYRILKIVLAALLVTTGSYLVFPESTIWFGTLHAIAIMSLLLLGIHQLNLGTNTLLFLAILVLTVGNLVSHPLFDTPALAWIGLMTHAPFTEDYVPLLPWFSVCLAGMVFMRWRLKHKQPHVLPMLRTPAWLRWIGRHSLVIYLLHQPLLLGILIPLSKRFPPS